MRRHDPLPSGRVSRNIDLVPACMQETLAALTRSAEFRSLESLEDQIDFFKTRCKVPMEVVATLLEKSESTLRRYQRATLQSVASHTEDTGTKMRYGPNSALTINEENEVLDWILARQKEQNCPTPLEVREFAASLKNTREGAPSNGKDHLSRDWWHKFKIRHKEVIGVKVAVSREQARTRCTESDVREYFTKMASIIAKVKTLKQIINMDETGFHSRIDRDRRRKCVYNKQCETHITFCQETASTTLSMMVAIAADAQVLRPMFVCREDIKFRSTELKSIKDFLSVSKSPKGYATEHNMMEWIDVVLVPYIDQVVKMLPDESDKVYLIMDNCGIHNSANVKRKWQTLTRLELVWFPPHTSHFLQMLDGSMFGALKSVYRNLRTPKTTPKIEGKIVRAYRAFWAAAFPTTVMSCFHVTGFCYTFLDGAPRGLVLDKELVERLIKSSCLASASQTEGEVQDGNLQ